MKKLHLKHFYTALRGGEERKMFIEGKIIEAVKGVLAGRVNELLGEYEFTLPEIEFSAYAGAETVCPSVVLSECERTEKERLILLDAYSLTIAFSLPETSESELRCYAYAAAVEKAFREDRTLDGLVDRIVLTGKKYSAPKKPHCGEAWEVAVTLRVTNEQLANNN